METGKKATDQRNPCRKFLATPVTQTGRVRTRVRFR